MTSKPKAQDFSEKKSISASISGSVSGQLAIGENITQTQHVQTGSAAVTAAELETLKNLIADLKAQVAASVPLEKQATALEKTSELEGAILAKEPDVTTMEYVRNWFVKNIPPLAGAVTGLVVNPIVGKLVEAAGETVAHEFKRRFGIA
jgi:hypothetical protein